MKKFLSFLICLCVVASLFPNVALAADTSAPEYIDICDIRLYDGYYLDSNSATTASTNYTEGNPYVALYKDGILKLNGIDITNNSSSHHAIYWGDYFSGRFNLTIELVEGSTNTLTDNCNSAINGANGFSTNGPSVVIQGGGTLNVTAGGNGIWVWKDITIQNGATVNVTGEDDSGISNNCAGTILIKPGTTVNVSGDMYGVKADNGRTGNFVVQGGNVTIKGGTSAIYSVIPDFGICSVSVSNNLDGSDAAEWDGSTLLTSYKYISLSDSGTPTSYDVATDAVENGTISVDITESVAGETITITATPNTGYETENISVTGSDGRNVTATGTGNTRTFTMPAKNVTASATFRAVSNYTITFDANGGTVTPTSDVTGADGKLSSLPTPTRADHTFNGWFTAASGGTEVTTSTVFPADTTIYAQWTYNAPASAPISSGGSRKYTVNFQTDGGSKVAAKRVSKNSNLAKPADPVKEGFEFDGWYTDKEFSTAYDFSQRVTSGFTLYAKWVAVETEKEPESENTTHDCVSETFEDLDVTKWYHEDVDYVLENKIMLGTEETKFAPDESLTRAMLVTILYRNEGEPATNRSIPFADIDMGAYYANAVVWAQQNGIVNGISETEFAPDNNVTREQLATIMLRYAQLKGMDAVTMEENLHFEDSDEISEYAVFAMNWGVGKNYIFSRTEGEISPKDAATRAEIAAFLHRFMENK